LYNESQQNFCWDFFIERLSMQYNPQQIEVINYGKGPCLVTAVPGSGKTACLTARIAKLIREGADPRKILAVTFTNKAAKEMKNRLIKAVGQEAGACITASTIHSLCARLLRAFHVEAGLPRDYIIYDSGDQESAIKASLCEIHGLEHKSDVDYDDCKLVMWYIENTRNSCLDDMDRSMMSQVWAYEAVDGYYRRLKKANAVDFTGLLSETLKLLTDHPKILSFCQNRWDYLSVDEVQDTNIVQYRIISKLAGLSKNILCVGDIDQSIYRFRGACPENIITFEDEFKPKVLSLETNYRSTPQILRTAQTLIERNSFRKSTRLSTENGEGSLPEVVVGEDDVEMAEQIVSFIGHRIARGIPPSEVAVLYRVNAASRVLERAFRTAGIPYKVIGGNSFWNRKEVKGCMGLLRLMANPNDRMAFERVSDVCLKGVGPKTVDKIMQASNGNLIEACVGMSCGKSQGAQSLGSLTKSMSDASSMSPGNGLLHIAKEIGFWHRMGLESDKAGTDRQENIKEMGVDVDSYMSKHKNGSIASYLQEISLMTANDEEQHVGKVNLMTMHAAKGLEFEVVVISHVNQGTIPHANALSIEDHGEKKKQIEEERRLMYVAMTRARKWLRIACCRQRFGKKLSTSMFLMEANLF
jgi:DNA helicase-2/ATP-dependent DNA helicase PcrA